MSALHSWEFWAVFALVVSLANWYAWRVDRHWYNRAAAWMDGGVFLYAVVWGVVARW